MLEAGNIKEWVDRISKPSSSLGGLSVCPYAKGAKYEVVHTDGSDIDPPPWDFELIIYVLPDYDQETVVKISNEYNKLFPDLLFLPDPKDRKTYINGVLTSNGVHNLILCQYRNNLNNAREKLAKTSYYNYWDKDYLEEILNA